MAHEQPVSDEEPRTATPLFVALVSLALAGPGAVAAEPAAGGTRARVVESAPLAASSIAVTPAQVPALLARLHGQRARVVADRLVIDDVAAEGRPWVGVIERRGDRLWLRTDDGAVMLAGPLARPRIAGPGYLAWVTGRVAPGAPTTLHVRRLGILAAPGR